ncbi:GNAT family N-acetyltransferase [Bacillus mangrovi]|uniref:GNAT family N-acetyltransferase n=1 Tax=Metabacillus mangrovi TaxID=1491830 RepID=A0A7X2S7R6_9BACI|nr:GNAT family N-acetyltransferase [Metabacillus mangrovi]MTH54818.1 GNAT family N-acetyltransferase [Metabacillus mangrovi]
MITVKKAEQRHVNGIVKVCSEGNRDTYGITHSTEYIERVIQEFYNPERVLHEVTHTDSGWDGYYVALEEDTVVGAIGGGMIEEDKSEIYVLYLNPNRRGEGIGTKLLQAFTNVQKSKGARQQWLSVSKGNEKGIPFYEARGFQFVSEQKSYASEEDESYVSLRYCRKI